MASNEDNKDGRAAAKAGFGCMVGMAQIVFIYPIAWVLWYRILLAIDAGSLEWTLFWVYVPANVVIGILAVIAKMLFELKD
jgi:hypothetical protein